MEILDINDNTPEFVPSPSASLSTYIRYINEGPESVNSVIIDANATDKDTGTNAKILYSMSGDEHGHFQLNSTTVSLTFLIHAVINFWSRHSSFSALHAFFSRNRVNYNSQKLHIYPLGKFEEDLTAFHTLFIHFPFLLCTVLGLQSRLN